MTKQAGPQPVTLLTVADGAAEELFQSAFKQVLSNLDDPNTAWKPKRKLVLTFTVACDESRRKGIVSVTCDTKLSGIKAVETDIYIGRHKGELIAAEAAQIEFNEPGFQPIEVAPGTAVVLP